MMMMMMMMNLHSDVDVVLETRGPIYKRS